MNRRGTLRAGIATIAAAALVRRTALAESAAPVPSEPALLPDLEIIDAHHHMVYAPARAGQPARKFLLTDLLGDIADSGHRVTATVVVQDFGMYRQDGPPELKSLGETEFLNGIAAMSASGAFGPTRVAAGIVAFASLRAGEDLKRILELHQRVAGLRMKGIRDSCAWDAFPVMGFPLDPARRDLFDDPATISGMRVLATMGLTLDTWCFHTQIHSVADAARAVPELKIVLDHVGSPLDIGPYAGRRQEVFRNWRASIRNAAKLPNLYVKLGGLGAKFSSPNVVGRVPAATSVELAALWRPYFETCIDAFGVHRCMFESNFPPEAAAGDYGTIWNTFKRITGQASAPELKALFSGTAKEFYGLA